MLLKIRQFPRFFTPLRFLCTTSSDGGPTLESMKPSQEFVKNLPKEMRKKYEKSVEELEIFLYMGKYIPNTMSDEDWRKTIEFEGLAEKVGFWEFLALTQRRRMGRDKKKESKNEDFKEFLNKEQKKYDEGGMGYGPDMYQIIHNPMRNKKKIQNVEGCRVFASMMTEMPKVALDLQYHNNMSYRDRKDMGRQLQYLISENFGAKRPLQLSFVNSPEEEKMKEWISNSIGYYGGEYTSQTILPDISRKGIKGTFPSDKNIIYLSNYARDVLDGPLTADVIGICITKDNKRESIGAARRAGIRSYRLPIARYVQWKSGPQFLPFPNILNTLRDVYENGGDWKSALHANISRRHLIDVNDDEKKQQQALRRKSKEMEKLELIEAIATATGGSS